MDTKGLPLERQINHNISKAKAASARLRKQGIFKGKLLQTILLRTFKSRIIPMLEYGINWQLPVKKEAEKIDKFIRNEIRQLDQIPFQ